ncbi:hypothetical protein KR200_004625, partial [Drosophila serrata]
MTAERDSLLQQLQTEMSKGEALQQELLEPDQPQQFVMKDQEVITEMDSLLQQLQQEISKTEALRQQLLEHEQSQLSVVNCAKEENKVQVQEMTKQIDDLMQQCQGFQDEVHDLAGKLEQINEENTCAICLTPWEGEGDHRIVSISCGHLFGKKCIRDYLARNSECPYCKRVVRSEETRFIYGVRT